MICEGTPTYGWVYGCVDGWFILLTFWLLTQTTSADSQLFLCPMFMSTAIFKLKSNYLKEVIFVSKVTKQVLAVHFSCDPALTHAVLKSSWLTTSSNYMGRGHQSTMGRWVINQLWVEGNQSTMRVMIMQQWGIGVFIFPLVCTGSQNSQNYFSNT